MKFVIDLLFAILFCLSLSGLGVVFFSRLLKTEIDFFTGFFGGCGIAVVILFIAGILGLFSKLFFIIFFMAIFVFAYRGIRKLLTVNFSINRTYLIPLILLILVLIVSGLASLSPPIKDDTLFYNLGLPKLWASDGSLEFYPWIAFSATALNSEVLLTPILSICSPEAAQFSVFLIGLLAMFLMAEGFYRHTKLPRVLIFLLIGAVTTYVSIIVNAKNDYLTFGFSVMAVLFYFDYCKSSNPKFIFLAGIFAGLAAGAKTNAVFLIISIFVILLIYHRRFKDIILFCAGAFILGFPWYLKAFIDTGNPVFPFYDSIFHSPYWREIFDTYNKATFVESEHRSLLNFITSPFRIVYTPDIFRSRLGPVPFMFLPLLVFIKPLSEVIKRGLYIAGIFYLLWYLAWPNARYLMPVIPVLILASAFVIDRLIRSNRLFSVIIIGSLCVIFVLTGIQVGRDSISRVKAAVGLIDHDSFLKTESVLDPNNLSSARKKLAVPYYDVWQFLNSVSQPDETVGILCSNWNRADGFYLDRRFVYLNPSEQITVDFTGDRESISRSIKEASLDYILIDSLVVDEFSLNSRFSGAPGFYVFNRGVDNFIDIIKQNGRLIHSADRFALYRAGK